VPTSEYVKLERRLVLAAWVCGQFGYSSNKAMLENLREVEEGYSSNGRSYLVSAILARGSKCLVAEEDFDRYDTNVHSHLTYFNKHLKETLTLRYFQHLALLATELFLDKLFNHERKLRAELNKFVRERNNKRASMDPQDARFTSEDLTKLALWMATGSGKTILMHFNYRQFLHYNRKRLDNILLVTPDESLSRQHIDNMEAAGIPCARFSLEDSGLETVARNAVRVIEITKLVEQKKGAGVSVPVEAFEGNNLIFVDEGHRGASSEANKWLGYRAKLAETGFTFEYSATFGQAMTAARDEGMTEEYGKAILFDYSYKYFYGDGFGKDFEVLNLRDETNDQQTRTLLLGNLLAFHEQKRAFQTKPDVMSRYHLADPLWIFVGSTVNKSKNNKQAEDSDVLTVLKFLDAFLRNERGWVQRAIKQVLEAQSGIEDDDGHDVFASKFAKLKGWTKDAEKIYRDLLSRVFHSASGGHLHVGDIKGKAGELGLKVSGSDHYFGLVYIGDTASFKTLIEEQCSQVELEEDEIGEGLFENIKRPDSRINILIGAKKFMQGWDSWRVTNMGLLNIGRSEGTEIIQLFGRGVRLKGLNRGLKRSSVLPGEHPDGIQLLERLNIFAVRANYMTEFRNYLEREGVDPLGDVHLDLPIKGNDSFLKKKLIVPRLPKESRFADDEQIVLSAEGKADYKVTLDYSTRLERMGSAAGEFHKGKYVGGVEHWLKPDSLSLLDWQDLYLDLLEFKEERSFHNLLIRPNAPREILTATDPRLHGLICDDGFLTPKNFEGVMHLQAAASNVLRKYTESFYRKRQAQWDSARMEYRPIKKDDENFQDYVVKVPRSDPSLIKAVKEIIDEGNRIYKQLCADLPGVYFERHLYQPLLIQKGSKVRCAPPALNDSERKFVNDMIDFCRSKPAVLQGKELFLLRNLSRGKGIGFFEDTGFYPDFILWITEGAKQRLVFIEPHGMKMETHPSINPKVNLYRKLKSQEEAARKKSKVSGLSLDAFVISATPFDDLQPHHGAEWDRAKYAEAHIFFGDEEDHGHLESIVSSG
jgi:hypothetical protein